MVKNEKVTNVSYTELGPHIKWYSLTVHTVIHMNVVTVYNMLVSCLPFSWYSLAHAVQSNTHQCLPTDWLRQTCCGHSPPMETLGLKSFQRLQTCTC